MWQPGTTQLSGAPGTMPITIAITELQRPPVPSVLSVQDRQVYVDNVEAPPPGYVLARRWMRNDPDVDVEHLPGTHNALVLPRPLPAGPNSNDEPPAFPDDSEHYDPEEAVRSLKQHWVHVRQHDTAQRMQRVARYSERLKAVTNPGLAPAAVNMVLTQALIAQQQQQQQASQGFPSLQAAFMLQQHQQQQQHHQGSATLPAVSAALHASANGQLLLQQGLAAQQQPLEEQQRGTQQQGPQQAEVDKTLEQEQDKEQQNQQGTDQQQQQQQEVKQEEQQQDNDTVAEQAEAPAG